MAGLPDSNPEPQSAQGLSLRALSEAFAQAMGGKGVATAGGHTPADAPPAEASPPGDSVAAGPLLSPPPEEEVEPDDDPVEISPATILEAMLFVGNQANQPLTPAGAASLMRGVEPEDVAGLVEELNRRYAAGGCPYHVVGDGPGYRITLRREYAALRNRFYGRVREARLSQAAIDVLAIVAYQQPLSADEVSKLRDKPSGHILAQLVHRQLLAVERDAGQPRKVRYRTTERFLHLFGLESLDDLPQAEDVEKRL